MLARLINSRAWQSQPTYRWEYLVAIVYLGLITGVATYGSDMRHAAAQVITSVAVFLTFCHMSVGSRLEEAQDRTDQKTVECYRKLTYYLVAKESLWLVAFLLLQAWTAIAGIPLFLFYPAWRRLYLRLRHTESEKKP